MKVSGSSSPLREDLPPIITLGVEAEVKRRGSGQDRKHIIDQKND